MSVEQVRQGAVEDRAERLPSVSGSPLPAEPLISARMIGIICLIVTALGWALAWPMMKIVLREWPPLFARGVAGVSAALVMAAIASGRRQSLKVPRHGIPRLLFAAFTNVFAWMGFSTLCMRWLTVGEGALLVYTMPIWTTLFAWPLLGTRPTPRGFAGLLLGSAGVAVLLSAQGFTFGNEAGLGVGFALAAAIFFALGAVLNRKPIPLQPIALTAWQVGLGCGPMVILGLIFERQDIGALTGAGLSAFVYVTIVSMGICYLTWFAALRRLPPATASTAMLLAPLLGIISAALLLGEPFGLREIVSMALTLGGVTLALRKG